MYQRDEDRWRNRRWAWCVWHFLVMLVCFFAEFATKKVCYKRLFTCCFFQFHWQGQNDSVKIPFYSGRTVNIFRRATKCVDNFIPKFAEETFDPCAYGSSQPFGFYCDSCYSNEFQYPTSFPLQNFWLRSSSRIIPDGAQSWLFIHQYRWWRKSCTSHFMSWTSHWYLQRVWCVLIIVSGAGFFYINC